MKIKSFLCGMLAIAATVACEQEEPMVTPSLEVSKTSALVVAAGEEVNVEVTANVDWTAAADQDWVSVNPASGKGSAQPATVKITVNPNETFDSRTATVTVTADKLSKTVKITQTGADQPEPETYILVGEAVGGWDPTSNGVILTLKDGYYVAKSVNVAAKKGMHFTKNASWEGNVKGKHGLIAPNEIGEVGSNDISLTEGGKFDVYLTEALDKFYFMSEGKLPSEAVEHQEIAITWGVIGGTKEGAWSTDYTMTQEGEWYVAKAVEFSDVNLKVRGNSSWADDVKWGREAEDTKCELNKAIPVSTCTEYKAANPSAGDNPNIYIGGSGTYDVYFSPEKKEVWVMTPGYKPGDEVPEQEPVEVSYTITGTVEGHYWDNSAEAGLMTLENGYYVVKNISLLLDSTMQPDGSNPADYVKFKICETGTWNAYGVASDNADVKYSPNSEIPVVSGGSDVFVDGAGVYDVYFDKENGKVWVMTAGYKPGDDVPGAGEPADYDIDGKQWTFTWQAMFGASCVIDFGVTMPGYAILAYDMGILDPSYEGIIYPYIIATYSIAKTDGTSGTITLTADGETMTFPYSNATANSVHIEAAAVLEEDIDCTLASSFIEIYLEAASGLADGEYWIVADGKVATPLSGNYGYLQVTDAVDGRSTAANAFTFTQVDAGLYTIQDSKGKYYYQTGTYNSFNVSDKDGGTDEYLWEVYDTGNGQFVIMNYAVGKFVQYDPAYNSYGSYEDERGTLPALVLAENPIEPEQPEIPELTGKFVKVSAEQNDWTGQYLIVFGDNAHATLTSKDLNSTAAVTDVNGEIEATSELAAAVMTVTKNGDKYVMSFPDGSWFGMQKNGCKLMNSAFDLEFAYTADGVMISGYVESESKTFILYHNSNNGNYYRCYVDKSGQEGYTLPTLYKYAE